MLHIYSLGFGFLVKKYLGTNLSPYKIQTNVTFPFNYFFTRAQLLKPDLLFLTLF